jgi:hypothetical protein
MAVGFKVLGRRGNCLFEATEGSLAAVDCIYQYTNIPVQEVRLGFAGNSCANVRSLGYALP